MSIQYAKFISVSNIRQTHVCVTDSVNFNNTIALMFLVFYACYIKAHTVYYNL